MSRFLKESWGEFWKSLTSKVGLLFLAIVLAVSIFTVSTMPLDYGTRYWSNPYYWIDHPKSAQPTWVNRFASEKLLEHRELSVSIPTSSYVSGAFYLKVYDVVYDLNVERFPTFIILKISNVQYMSKPPLVTINIIRPDGIKIPLYTLTIASPLADEQPPYIKHIDEPRRVLLSGEPFLARSLAEYLLNEYDLVVTPGVISSEIGYEEIIFGKHISENNFEPLLGDYRFEVILRGQAEDKLGRVTMILGGEVYGAMGTDILGRDLAKGLLFGFPIALLIGFTTSVIVTIIGASLGIIGGYTGGITDNVIQRVSDIVNNIPQLPLLIFFTFLFGGDILVVVGVLIAFGWPTLVIVTRSMILSIKEAPFVESAVAIGASRWRIMARHIFPQVAPYILSQMIFFTPSAILTEAALSFLGLGDPTLPTWGQILEYGFKNGAVYVGYWHWILPPGILIVFSAITFVLIALGLEPVVNPRLRRRR